MTVILPEFEVCSRFIQGFLASLSIWDDGSVKLLYVRSQSSLSDLHRKSHRHAYHEKLHQYFAHIG